MVRRKTQFPKTAIKNQRALINSVDSPFSGKKIRIVLSRKYGFQLFNTYLPTFSLLIIIYSTHYYKFSYYDLRIMVALTG